MWERSGHGLIYHGGRSAARRGGAFLGRLDIDTGACIEIPFPEGWERYGHFTVGKDGLLVADGYYEDSDYLPSSFGQWIVRLDVDWSGQCTRWTPICRSRSSWRSQDAHPHPILDHECRYVYFTSDRSGTRSVYRASVGGLLIDHDLSRYGPASQAPISGVP